MGKWEEEVVSSRYSARDKPLACLPRDPHNGLHHNAKSARRLGGATLPADYRLLNTGYFPRYSAQRLATSRSTSSLVASREGQGRGCSADCLAVASMPKAWPASGVAAA